MGTNAVYDANGNLISSVDIPVTAEETSAATIRQQAETALATNRTFIGRGTANTAAQVRDETVALARQMNGVIRLLLNKLDGTD